MPPMKLVIAGAAGRMGQSLIKMIVSRSDMIVSGALERQGSPAIGIDSGIQAGAAPNGVLITDNSWEAISNADAIIDFTSPSATVAHAGFAAKAGIVHVIGTTGCSAEDEAELKRAGQSAVIIKSGNMSLGVNLLALLVEQAARALDASDYDIEVLEMHHKHKVDAPSGTALLLGQAAASGRKIDLQESSVRVRDGITGPRPASSIGFATLRGGSVVGDHSVIFAGEGERIELSHTAQDRTVFTAGALKAAQWGFGKKSGFYSMKDVLGIK